MYGYFVRKIFLLYFYYIDFYIGLNDFIFEIKKEIIVVWFLVFLKVYNIMYMIFFFMFSY